MLASLGRPTLAAPAVPDVVVDAEARAAAPRLDAPIAEVTVYSDRARVRRRVKAALGPGAGPRIVRLPDLPGAVFADTIRLSATGARVLRVEAAPVERARFEIAQAKKLLDELEAVDDRVAALDDRAAVDAWLAEVVSNLKPAPPVPEEKREGRKPLAVDVASWGRALDFVGDRIGAARTRLAALADERRPLEQQHERLRAEIAALNQGGFSDRLVEVSAVVVPQGAHSAELELEYFVPGARWKPAYDLHYASARGEIRIETAAVVEQRTGEDWERATLALSTAIPGRGIALPELLTWTLGERSDFVPQLKPQPNPSPTPIMAETAPSAGAPPCPPPAADTLEVELVRTRLARAMATPPAKATRRYGHVGQVAHVAHAPTATASEESAPAPPPPARLPGTMGAPLRAPQAAPQSAMTMGSLREDEDDEVLQKSLPRRRSMSVLESAPAASRRSGPPTQRVGLSLLDSAESVRQAGFGDPELPAVSAGGLDYVYTAPLPATVPSTGRQFRIPLAAQTFRTAAFYEATPALATTAFLRARVRNDGRRPLLRGTATIFGDGELVGVGQIKTTGPGGDIELPLGADQDIRLVRQVVPRTQTTGLIMKSEETTYDVQIQVGNYKKQPIAIDVLDQVPTSRKDKVTVKLLGAEPALQGPADADGVVRWRLDLPAGATRTVRLRYQITRPKDWVLYQR